jgi:hypothetical protein
VLGLGINQKGEIMDNVTRIKRNGDNMLINCAEKNVYGRMLIYVTDEKTAKYLKILTNKTTLDYRDLEALQNLGFEIQLTQLPA